MDYDDMDLLFLDGVPQFVTFWSRIFGTADAEVDVLVNIAPSAVLNVFTEIAQLSVVRLLVVDTRA